MVKLLKGSARKWSAPRSAVRKTTPRKPVQSKRQPTHAEVARRETQKRIRAVERKLDRLEAKGVKVIGTEFDPRRSANLKNYNRKALDRYHSQLNVFMDRKTQFVPDAFGNPIPSAKMREYKRAEKAHNARIDKELARVADVKLPGMSMTLGERRKQVLNNSNRKTMAQGNNYWSKFQRESVNFFSGDKVDQAIKQMNDRMKPGFVPRTERGMRDQFAKLLDETGRDDITRLADQLSAEEFSILFHHSPVIGELAENYVTRQILMENKDQSIFFSEIDETLNNVKEVIQYAVESRALRGRLRNNNNRK